MEPASRRRRVPALAFAQCECPSAGPARPLRTMTSVGPGHTWSHAHLKWLSVIRFDDAIVEGAVDGGGNAARGNGNPAQCTGVTCS
jgi:hypothetical protein